MRVVQTIAKLIARARHQIRSHDRIIKKISTIAARIKKVEKDFSFQQLHVY